MFNLDSCEKLLLYWLSDIPEGANPYELHEFGPAEYPYAHRLERDCVLAGAEYPPRNPIQATKSVVAKGLLIAWRQDSNGKLKRLSAERMRKVDEDTLFELTEDGMRCASEFAALVRSEEGRRASFDFARTYVSGVTDDLSFRVAVPRYMPERFDPVPDVVTYADGDGVTLQYFEVVRSGDDQIFIDQTRAYLGDDETEYESESVRRDFISRVPATIRELQLTPRWVEIRIDWSLSGVSYRLSYHRSEGTAPDLDENVEAWPDADETISQWQGVDLPIDNEVQTAKIDDQMREECRRIAASLIEGA